MKTERLEPQTRNYHRQLFSKHTPHRRRKKRPEEFQSILDSYLNEAAESFEEEYAVHLPKHIKNQALTGGLHEY